MNVNIFEYSNNERPNDSSELPARQIWTDQQKPERLKPTCNDYLLNQIFKPQHAERNLVNLMLQECNIFWTVRFILLSMVQSIEC